MISRVCGGCAKLDLADMLYGVVSLRCRAPAKDDICTTRPLLNNESRFTVWQALRRSKDEAHAGHSWRAFKVRAISSLYVHWYVSRFYRRAVFLWIPGGSLSGRQFEGGYRASQNKRASGAVGRGREHGWFYSTTGKRVSILGAGLGYLCTLPVKMHATLWELASGVLLLLRSCSLGLFGRTWLRRRKLVGVESQLHFLCTFGKRVEDSLVPPLSCVLFCLQRSRHEPVSLVFARGAGDYLSPEDQPDGSD